MISLEKMKGYTVRFNEKEWRLAQALAQYLYAHGLIKRASVSQTIKFCMESVACLIAGEIKTNLRDAK